MTSYSVFPGIHLIYNDFRDSACFASDNSRSDLIEINHDLNGRFECEFKSNNLSCVGEGDFAVNLYSNEIRQAGLPLYEGIKGEHGCRAVHPQQPGDIGYRKLGVCKIYSSGYFPGGSLYRFLRTVFLHHFVPGNE